jgi:hypothetical protein
MKVYRRVQAQLDSFVALALDGGKWLTSGPGRLYSQKETVAIE